jgi:two-component system LytT family response regulator
VNIRTFVVEDEAPARRKVRSFIASDPELCAVGEAATGAEAVRGIDASEPDLLLLDVQLPDMTGFDVLARLERPPVVVFATAHDRYAIEAFEAHAFGYLLKPFDIDRFRKTIARAKQQVALARSKAEHSRIEELLTRVAERNAPYPARFLVEQAGRALFVPVAAVEWIEAQRNYLVFHSGKSRYMLRGTLEGIEKKLDPAEFLRVNRSAIAGLNAVEELRPWTHGEYRLVLRNGDVLPWTRRYVRRRPELVNRRFGADGQARSART